MSSLHRIRIWDLPIRLFHVALICAITGAIVTHYLSRYLGDNALLWHARCGYAALTLVLFRLGWGLLGSRYARFGTMLQSPRTVIRYALGQIGKSGRHWPGHNPLGALSVIAMLMAVLAQCITGLLSNDDIAFEGPWAKHIDKAFSDLITGLHANIGSKAIYALIALHVGAVLFYRLKKRLNLVKPMLTGDMNWHDTTSPLPMPAQDHAKVRIKALSFLVLCVAIVWALTQV